jgi:hypothetical protein
MLSSLGTLVLATFLILKHCQSGNKLSDKISVYVLSDASSLVIFYDSILAT